MRARPKILAGDSIFYSYKALEQWAEEASLKIRGLESLVELKELDNKELRKFTEHKNLCETVRYAGTLNTTLKCDCGLSELLNKH